jgi:hypothetical protein
MDAKLFGLDLVSKQIASVAMLYIVPIATIVALCTTIFQGLFSGGDIRYDFTPLFKAFLLIAIILGYSELAPLLHNGLDGFSHAVDNSTAVDDIMVKMQQAGSQNKSFWDNFSITKYLVNAIVEIGMSGIRYIMLALRDVMVSFLYAVGPLALALSIIPMFKQLATKWLQSFIYVHFWYLTMAVLDLLFKVYLQSYNSPNLTAGGATTSEIVMTTQNGGLLTYLLTNCVVIISYLLTPYLTSLYVGQSGAGAFMSKVAGAAMAAGGIGMKVISSSAQSLEKSQKAVQSVKEAASKGNGGGGGGGGSSSSSQPVGGFAAAFKANNSRPTQS